MNHYLEQYERATGKKAPVNAQRLNPLFAKIEAESFLPPRGQQAVDLGFPAHTLNDAHTNPALFSYYQWVLENCLSKRPNELSAKLIGMAFTCANLFQTDLPQPITLNPWQIRTMQDFPLVNQQAIIVENNGIFVLLHYRHAEWPLVNQGGNDFNESYIHLLKQLEHRGMRYTYLGDLDAAGIRIADHLFQQLTVTTIDEFTAIQSPKNVAAWLALKGRSDKDRTKKVDVQERIFKQEADSIFLFGKYVEQEQLIEEYERLIEQWLS